VSSLSIVYLRPVMADDTPNRRARDSMMPRHMTRHPANGCAF
jgi:hypothetical protein